MTSDPQTRLPLTLPCPLTSPGGVDTLVRLQHHSGAGGSSLVSADDFYSGTRAALAGGTTTVLSLATPQPGETLLTAYDRWRGWADGQVCCDYGLHVAVTSWSDKVPSGQRRHLPSRYSGYATTASAWTSRVLCIFKDVYI